MCEVATPCVMLECLPVPASAVIETGERRQGCCTHIFMASTGSKMRKARLTGIQPMRANRVVWMSRETLKRRGAADFRENFTFKKCFETNYTCPRQTKQRV